MKASKNNNWQGKGFLSELVKGEVHTEIPDGCEYTSGPPEQEKGMVMGERFEGARSGTGKKTTVV